MSDNDEIRVEVDPTLPRGFLKAIDDAGKTLGIIRGIRPSQDEGQFCQRRTVKLGKADYMGIMDYLYKLYGDTLFCLDYLLLSEKDYSDLQYEMRNARLMTMREMGNVNERGCFVKLANPATGKYATLATLPTLQEGEVMVMYLYE
jgi:hypothetical protein